MAWHQCSPIAKGHKRLQYLPCCSGIPVHNRLRQMDAAAMRLVPFSKIGGILQASDESIATPFPSGADTLQEVRASLSCSVCAGTSPGAMTLAESAFRTECPQRHSTICSDKSLSKAKLYRAPVDNHRQRLSAAIRPSVCPKPRHAPSPSAPAVSSIQQISFGRQASPKSPKVNIGVLCQGKP